MTDTNIELVALGLISAETGQSVDDLAFLLGPDAVHRDDIGLRCATATDARQLIGDHLTRLAEHAATAARNMAILEEAARFHQPVPAGLPAVEGLSAYETMIAANEKQKGNIWLDGEGDSGWTFEGVRRDDQ